jgi:hypothetical protein
MELKHTVELMNSECYKDRFVAEYLQTKIRYEKLKAFNNKLEAAERTQYMAKAIPMPAHDCPLHLLREQQSIMGQYLHLLEVRAVIEGIDLKDIVSFEREILSETIKEARTQEFNNTVIEALKETTSRY